MRVQPFAAVFVVCLSVSFRLCFKFYCKDTHYFLFMQRKYII